MILDIAIIVKYYYEYYLDIIDVFTCLMLNFDIDPFESSFQSFHQ